MRVLIDACVLYPTVMREVILGAAKLGLFEPRWSDRILEEWARATVKLGPEAEVFARGEIVMLGAQFPRAIVPVHQGQLPRLWLPDPDDIHVLAAAVSGSCDGILTMNAKDFPRDTLSEEGLARFDPDGFCCINRCFCLNVFSNPLKATTRAVNCINALNLVLRLWR